MKIALIGAGRIGQLHGRLVAAQPGVDEVIVTDVDAARAGEVAAAIGERAAYTAELLAFLRVARGEIPSPCTARDALEAMRISVAAGRSRIEGRLIRMSEIAQARRVKA